MQHALCHGDGGNGLFEPACRFKFSPMLPRKARKGEEEGEGGIGEGEERGRGRGEEEVMISCD